VVELNHPHPPIIMQRVYSPPTGTLPKLKQVLISSIINIYNWNKQNEYIYMYSNPTDFKQLQGFSLYP